VIISANETDALKVDERRKGFSISSAVRGYEEMRCFLPQISQVLCWQMFLAQRPSITEVQSHGVFPYFSSPVFPLKFLKKSAPIGDIRGEGFLNSKLKFQCGAVLNRNARFKHNNLITILTLRKAA